MRSLSTAPHPRGGRQGRAQGRDPVAGGTDHETRVHSGAHLLRGNAHQRSVGHDGRALHQKVRVVKQSICCQTPQRKCSADILPPPCTHSSVSWTEESPRTGKQYGSRGENSGKWHHLCTPEYRLGQIYKFFINSSKSEHPNYNAITHNFDFCLLQLASAVNFADRSLSHVAPACWPTGNEVPNSQAS